METFMAEYAKNLEKCVRERPEDYYWSLSELPMVLTKMRHAISSGSFNKESPAFKATCKALGIKHTYTAINRFIDNHA